MRGGLKGGLPICERNALAPDNGLKLAATEGNMMSEADVAKKPKCVSWHIAMDEQWSHGFALWGQQSMSSIAAMSAISVMSVDFTAILALATAGSMATESAMRSARMVRPTFIVQPLRRENSRSIGLGVK